MFEDRPYQLALMDSTIEELSSKRKVHLQLPTGGGKTVIFALITQRFVRNTGQSVIILVHREELMYQASRTIKEITGFEACLITSTSRKYQQARIYIGMIDSTVKRLDLFEEPGLVIIDECHIASFNKAHELFMSSLIIGVSATSISSSKKEPLNKYYNSIVTGPQINELIKLGYLAQNITRCPKDIVDSTQFEIDNRKGDYNENQMAIEYRKPKHVMNVIRSYKKYSKGEKCIIFNVNIEHSKEVTLCFQTLGYNARYLHGDATDEERKSVLHWFKTTPDAILCNVMIATVGFDEPTIRNVFLNFSSLSVVKFIQCSGRGGRPIDEALAYQLGCETKDHFNIIDLGGNCIRFGDWNDDRDWQYIFNHPSKPGEGLAPVKTCPNCEGLIHASLRVCPLKTAQGEFCGHEFERRKSPEEKDLEEMILITKGIDINELVEKSRNKYQYYPMFALGHEVVQKLYEDFPEPSETTIGKYFRIYYKLCIEWYNSNLAKKEGNLQDITNSAWHIIRARNNFYSLVQKEKPKVINSAPSSYQGLRMEDYSSVYGHY